MSNTLKEVAELLGDINRTNSSNEKMKILGGYPHCKKILEYIYSDFKQYNVTSANIEKMKNLKENVSTNFTIFQLLNDLESRKITGHKAIGVVNGFIANNKKYEDIILRIIDKDLRIGMGVSNINKVFKGLIPTFDVALANSYDKVAGKVDITEFYGSHKLDGLRCVTIKKGNTINFYSRKGKEFLTLDVLKEDLKKIKGDFVFDGELCIVDENGKEDFTSIMKVYKKKDFTIPNPKYKVFDCLTIKEFESKTSERILSERLAVLKLVFSQYKCKTVDVLDQVKLNDQTFSDLQSKALENGWEGLILRKDDVYKGKRSNDLLKVKKFKDAEYVVKSIETGLFQVVEDGDRKQIKTLTAVVIEHKGYEVSVGFGIFPSATERFF